MKKIDLTDLANYVSFALPKTFKCEVVMIFCNGYPEFDLVPAGSSDELVVWRGDVKLGKGQVMQGIKLPKNS